MPGRTRATPTATPPAAATHPPPKPLGLYSRSTPPPPPRRDNPPPQKSLGSIQQVHPAPPRRQPGSEEDPLIHFQGTGLAVHQEAPAAVLVENGAEPLRLIEIDLRRDPGVLQTGDREGAARRDGVEEEGPSRSGLLPDRAVRVREDRLEGGRELDVRRRQEIAHPQPGVERVAGRGEYGDLPPPTEDHRREPLHVGLGSHGVVDPRVRQA